ncbi:hypothetical protein KAH94_05720 [bacterium]|nr:hypothetical protein [bacterium]
MKKILILFVVVLSVAVPILGARKRVLSNAKKDQKVKVEKKINLKKKKKDPSCWDYMKNIIDGKVSGFVCYPKNWI